MSNVQQDFSASYTSIDYRSSDSLICGTAFDTSCDLQLFDEDESGKYQNISCPACYFEEVSASDFFDGTVSCSSDYQNCHMNCQGSSSCTDRSIYCSSAEQCNHCIVNCASDDSCFGITVYPYNCDYVEIRALGENSIKGAAIYSPTNGTLHLFASNVFDYIYAGSTDPPLFFSNNIIYGNMSHHVRFHCVGTTCADNRALTQTSLFFELNCYDDAYCYNNSLYCPDNELYDGLSCEIIYINSTADANNYFARDGMPTVETFFFFFLLISVL